MNEESRVKRKPFPVFAILALPPSYLLKTIWENRLKLLGASLMLAAIIEPANAQQFNSDNQWVAPHGVATFVFTLGQEYSAVIATAALLPETEFNFGVTRYEAKPSDQSKAHYTGSFYIKRRLFQNEAENGGLAVVGGTGVDPGHLSEGEVTDTFQTWWVNAVYTVPFLDGQISWDLLPGAMVNLDKDQGNEAAWGMTWSSRVAVYKLIPQSAIVGEVYGTAGEAYAEPTYRAGVRWESPKSRFIVAATYGDSFSGYGSPRFELGVMILTPQLKALAIGKLREDPDW